MAAEAAGKQNAGRSDPLPAGGFLRPRPVADPAASAESKHRRLPEREIDLTKFESADEILPLATEQNRRVLSTSPRRATGR